MSDDIVKRLRERSGKYDECDWHSYVEIEAADEIERLRAALKYWDEAFATGRSELLYVARDNGRTALSPPAKDEPR